jgi:hypothetical protein
MEAIRNFAASSGTIMNVIYVIVFLIVLYYLYRFLMSGSELEVNLLRNEVDGNTAQAFLLPVNKPEVRVKSGGEYTISFWMYINSWDYRSGLAKSVLQIVDNNTASDSSLFTTILYPNEPKLMVRVYSEPKGGNDGGTDYNKRANFDQLLSGQQGTTMFAPSIDMPMCDVQDIDLQRWINITVSVNGRIVDVYYDGKLTRSCVLPDIPVAPNTGTQSVIIGQKGGFGGKVSGIQFFAYPLTPDRIYSIYQAGPGGAAGFLGFVMEKLGLKITYSGALGVERAALF